MVKGNQEKQVDHLTDLLVKSMENSGEIDFYGNFLFLKKWFLFLFVKHRFKQSRFYRCQSEKNTDMIENHHWQIDVVRKRNTPIQKKM